MKKLALSDDEIILGFILGAEGAISDGELTRLYAEVLPCLKIGAARAAALKNARECGWTKDEFRRVIREMPLGQRLATLVPCSFICARNITDAYLRGGRVTAELGRFFAPREKGELMKAVDARRAMLADDAANIRKVRAEVIELITSSKGDRLKLRRRAAAARAKLTGGVAARGGKAPIAMGSDGDITAAAAELFPAGLRASNAIAVRLVLKRVPRADKADVSRVLASMYAGDRLSGDNV